MSPRSTFDVFQRRSLKPSFSSFPGSDRLWSLCPPHRLRARNSDGPSAFPRTLAVGEPRFVILVRLCLPSVATADYLHSLSQAPSTSRNTPPSRSWLRPPRPPLLPSERSLFSTCESDPPPISHVDSRSCSFFHLSQLLRPEAQRRYRHPSDLGGATHRVRLGRYSADDARLPKLRAFPSQPSDDDPPPVHAHGRNVQQEENALVGFLRGLELVSPGIDVDLSFRACSFWIVFAAIFCWTWIPTYVFPLLTAFSIVCLADRGRTEWVRNIFGAGSSNEG